ncbi:MAG TPA: malonate decarboxylase holo-[acyl-carrier-protein] synthase [Bradyrhizobium sp.]
MTSPCTPIERSVGRHDLVFVSRLGWRALLATRVDLAADPLVSRWPDQDWPAIRRRAMPGETAGVALGLPLPPSAGKKRIAFLLPPCDIVSIVRPPSLEAASGAAPRAWWPTLDRLSDLALRHSAEARVFGSLAWRFLTGLDYVSDRSDLDLLLDCHRDTDLDRLAADIAAIEADAPMRLDGELMRDDGAAVNWREFHAGAAEVLVKRVDGIGLLDRRHFIFGKTIP